MNSLAHACISFAQSLHGASCKQPEPEIKLQKVFPTSQPSVNTQLFQFHILKSRGERRELGGCMMFTVTTPTTRGALIALLAAQSLHSVYMFRSIGCAVFVFQLHVDESLNSSGNMYYILSNLESFSIVGMMKLERCFDNCTCKNRNVTTHYQLLPL